MFRFQCLTARKSRRAKTGDFAKRNGAESKRKTAARLPEEENRTRRKQL